MTRDTRLTCAACGHEGYDVIVRIVEVESSATMRVQGHDSVYEVPERFRSEPRCISRPACQERQDAKP